MLKAMNEQFERLPEFQYEERIIDGRTVLIPCMKDGVHQAKAKWYKEGEGVPFPEPFVSFGDLLLAMGIPDEEQVAVWSSSEMAEDEGQDDTATATSTNEEWRHGRIMKKHWDKQGDT